ncbi:hypothetical protein TPY_2756 [Sulfobacillus acidophilus TPY]|uniref:Uncharacterized protein n=1 Tax=Sulfobacillus acidophilus (strain ATCC 700253 / DSM 10332 / NAL) TaxID=679936 RepID=G8TUH6_SULAD|nr:hypothetical protein TPY_2756 [Sulfobacillus acidophilus TPY]AEW04623.1 hypothetical protein Sulac_1123 [Sulfobacillus acidophilus DSM 10332]
MDTSSVITQAEAARRLHVSRTRIQALVKKGKLRAVLVNGKTMIDVQSLNERLVAADSPRPSNKGDLAELLAAVRTFHALNGLILDTGTRQDLLLRLALLQGEVGEIAAVVTKSPIGPHHGFTEADVQRLQEEWADILYVMLGWAVEMGWTVADIQAAFDRVHHKNIYRGSRHTALMRPTKSEQEE